MGNVGVKSELLFSSKHFKGSYLLSIASPATKAEFALSIDTWLPGKQNLFNGDTGNYTIVSISDENTQYMDINSILTDGSDSQIEFRFCLFGNVSGGECALDNKSESAILDGQPDLVGHTLSSINLDLRFVNFTSSNPPFTLQYDLSWEFWIVNYNTDTLTTSLKVLYPFQVNVICLLILCTIRYRYSKDK